MNRPTNKTRAVRAGCALHTYKDGECMAPSEVLSDLLCDLQHYADSRELDFSACLERGNNNHYQERLDDET
jgi:hypothetical protein